MALELNSTCSICGKKYHSCKTCADVITYKPWQSVVDSMEHYQIYHVIWSYTNKHFTKDKAREELKKCNLNGYKTFVPSITKVIDEILKTDRKDKKKIFVENENINVASAVSDGEDNE